jgi:hypothetical protein
MYQAEFPVENPFDGGVANAVYYRFEIGEIVQAIDYRDFEIRSAKVIGISDNPRVISAADLWVEHVISVMFEDGHSVTITGGDAGGHQR